VSRCDPSPELRQDITTKLTSKYISETTALVDANGTKVDFAFTIGMPSLKITMPESISLPSIERTRKIHRATSATARSPYTNKLQLGQHAKKSDASGFFVLNCR